MERLNKKISHIEKALNKMSKEISSIKDLTKNTNSSNNINNSVNLYKKNSSMTFLKNNQKQINSKNYFKLTDKEKRIYENRKNKSPHSYHIKKKTQINNDMMNYIKKAETLNQNDGIICNTDINNINDENEKYNSYNYKNKGINQSKEFSRISFINELMNENNKNNNENSSIENNFGFESQNIFFNYNKSSKNKGVFNYRKQKNINNKIKKNKSENKKNTFNNFSEEQINQINSMNYSMNKKNRILNKKSNNLNINDFKKMQNRKYYDFNDLINENCKNYIENSKNNFYIKKKGNKIKKNNSNSIFKLNKNISKDFFGINSLLENNENENNNECILNNNKYSSTFDEIENDLNNLKNRNKNNEDNENIKEKYLEIEYILEDTSIEDINNKALLFDEFGSNGFQKFKNLIDSEETIFNSENNIYKYLQNYKDYISFLKTNKEYNYFKKMNSYKILCDKLLAITEGNNLEKISKKINNKLKKNENNKMILEKIKNILFELNNKN
jgi:hypothetical protein